MEFGRCVLFGILVLNGLLVRGTAEKLIVVLVDGVRWDYINDPKLKGFNRLINSGVRARYVVPVFPSLSYPNYQTIVTGLYPENHGFISNNPYYNATDSVFYMIPNQGSTDTVWWNDAEPVWITAEKQGMRSALYWWAGCEVEIRGGHPTVCERQMDFGPPSAEAREDFLERTDDLLEMFRPTKLYPKGRMSLALMYYGSVDYAGHYSGPKSPEVKSALTDIDDILDKMQNKLKKAGLENDVNIMVVSDHGMTDISKMKKISIKKFQPKTKHQLGCGGVSMLVPQPGMLDKLYQEILDEKLEGLMVYKKEDVPEKYHIKRSLKTPSIVLISKPSYFIDKFDGDKDVGSHGFDPEESEDMRAIFVAAGPDFRRKYVPSEPLQMVDIYNVICSVLKVPPLPNNGSWDRVHPMLLKAPERLAADNSSAKCCCFIWTLLLTSCITMFQLTNSRFV